MNSLCSMCPYNEYFRKINLELIMRVKFLLSIIFLSLFCWTFGQKKQISPSSDADIKIIKNSKFDDLQFKNGKWEEKTINSSYEMKITPTHYTNIPSEYCVCITGKPGGLNPKSSIIYLVILEKNKIKILSSIEGFNPKYAADHIVSKYIEYEPDGWFDPNITITRTIKYINNQLIVVSSEKIRHN